MDKLIQDLNVSAEAKQILQEFKAEYEVALYQKKDIGQVTKDFEKRMVDIGEDPHMVSLIASQLLLKFDNK